MRSDLYNSLHAVTAQFIAVKRLCRRANDAKQSCNPSVYTMQTVTVPRTKSAEHIAPTTAGFSTVSTRQTLNSSSGVTKSDAQVETWVTPQVVSPMSGELKLDFQKPKPARRKRGNPLTVRLSQQERGIIATKAKEAGCTINHYVRASVMGSHYKPPRDPQLVRALVSLNRELTAQGNNLNQIARHLNSGLATVQQGFLILNSIRTPLIAALVAVKSLLRNGRPEP